MSWYNLPKLSRYLPLWRRPIPNYPLWFRKGPQLRIMMPLFWMKMVKPTTEVPPFQVKFEVHPQMTRYDVKNYLEKIYNISVDHVRTCMVRGVEVHHPEQGFVLRREPDQKMAYVWLGNNDKFEFPNIFAGKDTEEGKNVKDMEKLSKEMEKSRQSSWHQSDIPTWFR